MNDTNRNLAAGSAGLLALVTAPLLATPSLAQTQTARGKPARERTGVWLTLGRKLA